jgi:copper oxidase (laccase) domain-containing protein
MVETTITFENEDKTKKAVITISNKGDSYDVDLEFIPDVKTESTDLYAVMAVKFVKHLSS